MLWRGWIAAVEAIYDGGDHSIILGRVEALSATQVTRCYYRGRYGRIELPADITVRKGNP